MLKYLINLVNYDSTLVMSLLTLDRGKIGTFTIFAVLFY